MNEAEVLFTEILNCNRISLYLNKDAALGESKSSFVASVLKRRISGYPLPYILGKTEFMGLEFRVTPDVFIPRPETEILVERALKIGHRLCVIGDRLKVLDIGTGSGCIAISLAKFLSNVNITATDISPKATEIAKYNALLNNVADKIKFINSNLLTHCALRTAQYDIITSNPPYIPTKDIDNLQPELRYEPLISLDGGRDGLDFYRKLITRSVDYLRKDGYLVMEMGFGQRRAIETIFQSSGNFEIIDVVKDYKSINRVIVAKYG